MAYIYAPSARPDGAFLCPDGARGIWVAVWQNRQVNVRPLPATLAVLALAIALPVLALLAAPAQFTASGAGVPSLGVGAAAPLPSPDAPKASNAPPGDLSTAVDSGAPSTDLTPAPTSTSPAPTLTPAPPTVAVAIVPVTNFRATANATGRRELAAVLAGTSDRYEALELVASEADAILAELGLTRPADATRLIVAPDATTVAADLAKSGRRLAFLRADAIGPSIRALAWGRTALFGVDRVTDRADWPLIAAFPAGSAADTFNPAATWTLFAGGDILLDRGVYKTVVIEGKGVDFPFDGGTADIVGRTCCSAFGWEQPRTKRTGNAGAVRAFINGADLAIANFENPAPDNPRYHTRGTVFSAEPTLIEGLANAGFDFVSLANNHIRDAGGQGILQTIANLRERGIEVGGAGVDLAAARRAPLLEAGGVRVAVLGYDAIAGVYHATDDKIGSAPLAASIVRADIKAARAAGADLVIVFPHWGTEYRATPSPAQRKLARSILDAGADMIIGNHAHWAAAMEVYKGKPIWYALGNFVFDQTWSEPTMEGITLELTFSGADLLQVRIRPHIILDRAQPNLLDPAGDGRIVLNQLFAASKGLLPW